MATALIHLDPKQKAKLTLPGETAGAILFPGSAQRD